MRVIELVAENVKKLKAVQIRPTSGMVVISGKNGAGKTSVLDSLWWCLAGANHIQAVPIRKGAKKARIRLDLGELIVTRTFAKDSEDQVTTALTVESADGARYSSPQKMLDALLGELSFDPLAFARADAKEQLETLRSFVPGVDFKAIDRANDADFARRTDINRSSKEKRAQAQGIQVPEFETKPEAIDESQLVTELEQAGKANTEIEQRKANRERVAQDAQALDREAVTHETQVAEYEQRAQKARAAAAKAKADAQALREKLAAADALPEPVDTAKIREAISKAREHNLVVQRLAQRQKIEDDAAKLEEQSKALTAAIDERKESAAKAIAAAELPVPGLAFGDGEVMLAGVPFAQASDAEQLRASVAIAAALNPKLRVIRIRDGSLLDEDGMKLVAEMADAQDMQVWVERVDTSGKVGFVIQDGALVEQETEQAEAATG